MHHYHKKCLFTYIMMPVLLLTSLHCVADPIQVTVNFSNTPTNYYYCMKIHAGVVSRNGCGFPIRLGTGFINRYLRDIEGSPEYYIRFAYSEAQPYGKWPAKAKTCQFTLNQNAHLSVNITNTGCKITSAYRHRSIRY